MGNSAIMASGTLLSLVSISYGSKILSFEQLGEYLNAINIVSILVALSILGLSELSVKHYHDNFGFKIELGQLIPVLVNFLIVMSIFPIVNMWLDLVHINIYILLLFLALLSIKIIAIYLRASSKIKLSNIANVIFYPLFLLLGLFLYTATLNTIFDLMFFIALLLLLTTFLFIILDWSTIRRKLVNTKLPVARYFYDNIILGASVVFNSILVVIDQVIAAKYLGFEALAAYKVCLIIFLCGIFPHVVINTIAGPKISKLINFKKHKMLKKFWLKFHYIQFIFASLAVISIYIIFQLSNDLLFARELHPSKTEFLLMSLAAISASWRGFSTIIIIQLGHFKTLFIGQILYLLVFLISIFALFDFNMQISVVLSFSLAQLVYAMYIQYNTKIILGAT